MNHVLNLIMGELGVIRGFLADGAIDEMFRAILHQIENERAFAESHVLVGEFGRAVAPTAVATERSANETGVGTRINAFDGYVVTAQGELVVHLVVGSGWITKL